MRSTKSKTQQLVKVGVCLFAFTILSCGVSYATSYEVPNVVIGKNSTKAEDVIIDENNPVFDQLLKKMNKDDSLRAYVLISEYRKGNKDVAEEFIELVRKYDKDYASQISYYILDGQATTYLTSYHVDHNANVVTRNPVKVIETYGTKDIDMIASQLWETIVGFVPADFYNMIENMHIERNKDPQNLITICELSNVPYHWDINIDISLLLPENEEELKNYLMYITVYYYILRDDQVEKLVTPKGNYVYAQKTYRSDSYINKFYKKFWKGRREETNVDQYELYKKEFLNGKASRTVYDDMAVSFVNYVKNGYMRRYLGFRADKTNFFDEYELFRNLAKQFRVALGIRKI